jgi:peptidoglycan/LPS O-acetylase OafA/YrhL
VGGHPSGFDYLRLGLAIAVVVWHSVVAAEGVSMDAAAWRSAAGPLARLILPLFFALSGFLVAGSLERSRTLITFLGLRALRIYPALAVECLTSALLIGPALTTTPLKAYFADRRFRSYLLNMFGDVHFRLPGLFASNPFPDIVNAQLWTVPYELGCYALLAGLAVLGLVKRRWIGPLCVVGGLAAFAIPHVLKAGDLANGNHVFGPFLLMSFVSGVTLYIYRDRAPWDYRLAAPAGALLYLSALAAPSPTFSALSLVLPPLAAYCVVYVGLLDPPKLFFMAGADYSYGIFLYGFVVQQCVSLLLPWARHWYLNVLVALPLATAFAAVSWRFVERPALGLRPHLKQFEASVLARLGRATLARPA